MFYCREKELKILSKRYENDKFEFVVVYGRRRIGKTALLNEFCRDKKTIYFPALQATSAENLKILSKAIELCKNPQARIFPEYSSYQDAFEEIENLARNERIIFVIDEFPYLAKAENSISSRLQHMIDHSWSETKLFLILCGSSMSFMEKQVLGYESPLYGRRTAQIFLEALHYNEIKIFNPQLSNEDTALIYGITGGVPHYINRLNISKNIDEALLENFFNASAYLFEEPENLLKQELREPATYSAIITAIAEGATKMSQIASRTGFSTNVCAKYLNVLMELGIVGKDIPIGENQKKSLYVIKDNLFRFWYRFIPQNIALIMSGRFEQAYQYAVKDFFSDYMGLVFEQMCKDYLLYVAENLPIQIQKIGRWWGNDPFEKKEIEIDIVAQSVKNKNEPTKYIIGSCKYTSREIGVEEFEKLKNYASVFARGAKCYFYIFSKSGFTKKLQEFSTTEEVKLITLDELYF